MTSRQAVESKARPDRAAAKARGRAAAAVSGVPRIAWLCALVGVLSAAAWSLLTPPFMVPDEEAHYAYAEQISEHGRPPAEAGDWIRSAEQLEVAEAQKIGEVVGRPDNIGVWSELERSRLETALATTAPRDGNGYSYGAGPQPPLYYALAAIPYRVASDAPLVDRLALMRLISVLLAGLTVLFVFLFLREALPSSPWAWPIGALGVALHPLFGFMSGGVNPDALLFACSAALFYCVARGFRRGVTPRLALATGVVLGVGLLAKLTILGIAPAIVLGLVVAARRDATGGWPRALGLGAAAAAVAIAPLALVGVLNLTLWDRPFVGLLSSGGELGERSLLERLNYAWQLYLPRIPGTPDLMEGVATRAPWWHGYVGWLGPLDARFADHVYLLALIPVVFLLTLLGRGLLLARATLRVRLGELAIYALAVAGMLALVAAQSLSFDADFGTVGGGGGQLRYFFTLLPLYAALLVLAARGAGPRFGPAAGVVIVALALGHDIAGQLLVVGRYYG